MERFRYIKAFGVVGFNYGLINLDSGNSFPSILVFGGCDASGNFMKSCMVFNWKCGTLETLPNSLISADIFRQTQVFPLPSQGSKTVAVVGNKGLHIFDKTNKLWKTCEYFDPEFI